MADSLSPETNAQIDKLCRKIAVAQNLDDEIQAELRGHMEDKLLAYLNGEEPVSESDAFLLVRQHFGDPTKVKSLLQDVHIVETGVSLSRRLAAIAAVYLGYVAVTALASTVAGGVASWLRYIQWDAAVVASLLTGATTSIVILCTYGYWRVMRRWRRQERAGNRLWFQRWRGLAVAEVLVLLALLQFLVPVQLYAFTADVYTHPFSFGPPPSGFIVFNQVVAVACLVWVAGTWLWWCDTSPRRPRTLVAAALTWLGLAAVPWSLLSLIGLTVYAYDPATSVPDLTGELVLWNAHSGEYSGIWSLRTLSIMGRSVYQFGYLFGLSSLFELFAVAVAAAGYLRFMRRGLVRANRAPQA